MKGKKVLALSLVAVSVFGASCALVLNRSRFSSAYAGGIVANGANRTLTIDNETSVTITDGKGIADLGNNLKAYSPDCEKLTNGFLRLNTGRLFLYYDEVIGGYGTYRGFGEATVTSLSAKVMSSNQMIYARWCFLQADYSNYQVVYSSSVSTELNDDEKTITFDSGDFINEQDNAKYSMYFAIVLESLGNTAFDVNSLTLSYTCN